MATITGLTAERMLEIEAASVVDGDVVGNDLFLYTKDGTPINAGNVRGIQGIQGPMGEALAALSAQEILDVGAAGQVRAGRQLTPADFTNMGLSAPLGLWNLSALTDSSGNGRNLTNKGAVPFDVGINGLPATAARFAGSTGQALYIPDLGASDSFRIKTGTFGCWMRTGKRGVAQAFLGKWNDTGNLRAWMLAVDTSNNSARLSISFDGTLVNAAGVSGISDICDDKWHFVVASFDTNRLKIYIDGLLESSSQFGVAGGPLAAVAAPFNIGANNADAATAGTWPHFGRIDEAFVTDDVLSDAQIRNLYCASVAHALGSVPTAAQLSVRRRNRGAVLPVAAFPVQPLRLYNFVNGVYTDQGSNNVPVAAAGGGVFTNTHGPDGAKKHSMHFGGASIGLGSSDAGLPSGLNPRTYGCWVKSTQSTAVPGIIGWGNGGSSASGASMGLSNGSLYVQSGVSAAFLGPYIAEGMWHFCVIVEDNTAVDGLKQKMYVDGRLVASATTLSSITLGGANRFRLGAYPDSAGTPFGGHIAAAFVSGVALTGEQVRALFNASSPAMAPSPKDAAPHIEAMEAARLLVTFDSIESNEQIDLGVL